MSQHLVLQQVSTDDLRELIRLAVAQALEMSASNLPQGTPEAKPLLTREEAARILRVSIPTLHRRVKEGALAPLRVGTRVLFRRSDIDALIGGAITATEGGAR